MENEKNLKFFIRDVEKLSEEEKRSGRVSYRTLIEFLFTDMILANELPKTLATKCDEFLEDNIIAGSVYDYENDYYIDIYQYFIVDFSNYAYKFIQKYFADSNDIILFYSDILDIYVLGVDHFGTSWDYVLTDIEYTTEFKGSMQDSL